MTDWPTTHYAGYRYLRFSSPADGVLEVLIDRPERMNATDEVLHTELTRVWRDVADDERAAAVLITGSGRAFSAGGDFAMLRRNIEDWPTRIHNWDATVRLVQALLDCPRPIVSAINGVAVGAGLAVALLADIPIAARSANLLDGHVRLGVAAGDHAVLLWPLLCGMAKAKYHLLTGAPIDGTEAERLGLVALVTEDEDLLDTARRTAAQLASGPPVATRLTKHALNNWLRAARPMFDASAALEFLTFSGPEVREGLNAHLDKRPPRFDRAEREAP